MEFWLIKGVIVINSPMRICEDAWESHGAAQTYAWGQRLGRFLCPGDLLCLYGDLGAGKTLLAQGIGQALNVPEPVTSPTFTMIQSYQGQQAKGSSTVTLVHMDLYRLRSSAEAEIIGVWDFMGADSVNLIEWPEIIADDLPEDRYEVHIEGSGGDPRAMRLSFLGAMAQRWDEWQSLKPGDNS